MDDVYEYPISDDALIALAEIMEKEEDEEEDAAILAIAE